MKRGGARRESALGDDHRHCLVPALDAEGNSTGDVLCIIQECGYYTTLYSDPKPLPDRDEAKRLGNRWGSSVLPDESIEGRRYYNIVREGHVGLSLGDTLYLRDELVPILMGLVLQTRGALRDLVENIEAAGLLNLSMGVQLGATSWYVKANDCLGRARRALDLSKLAS